MPSSLWSSLKILVLEIFEICLGSLILEFVAAEPLAPCPASVSGSTFVTPYSMNARTTAYQRLG
jgi:hypothetical protein